jgi:hypothetical protein
MKRITWLSVAFIFTLSSQQGYGQALLNPTTTQPGTPEESGIITTLALTYVKVRNTVRDAYLSIQYTKGMIQTLDDQKDWVERNLKGWDQVRKRVVRLVEEPGRWDKKLVELEKIFDKTDYLLFEESKAFDDLMYRQERYWDRLGAVGTFVMSSRPYVSDFFKFNGSLYRSDPGFVPAVAGADVENENVHREFEAARLAEVKARIAETPEGKVRDATILAASRAQAQLAALRRMKSERAAALQQNLDLIKSSDKVNTQELGRTLVDLKGLDNDMDDLTLRYLEMEMIFAQYGTSIYDMSKKRAGEMTTAISSEDLAAALSKP